jgi:beta-phosphoglucomutase-like phosphatase (HAD superfamily)
MSLSALIFDVDGTLANTERDGHRVAYNRAFREAGLDWEWTVELYGELLAVTGGKERMRFYLEKFRPDFKAPPDLDRFIGALYVAKTRHYTELVTAQGIPLRPGVLRLLGEARDAGLRLAIATTTNPANVSALLESNLGPPGSDWFEFIGAGDVVPAKKPAPDIFHYVLEHLRLTPQQCMAFEDSENGLRAALAAGLTALVTVNDYTRDEDFSGASLVLDRLGEPDAPFTVLAGDAHGAQYVDVTLLRRLHGSDP